VIGPTWITQSLLRRHVRRHALTIRRKPRSSWPRPATRTDSRRVLKVAPQYYYTCAPASPGRPALESRRKDQDRADRVGPVALARCEGRRLRPHDHRPRRGVDIANYANPKYYTSATTAVSSRSSSGVRDHVDDKARRELYVKMQKKLVETRRSSGSTSTPGSP